MDRELAHQGLTELVVVETLHERKAEMAALADGFIALPGGLGTLEELAEVASWAQLGLHAKPIGLLGDGDYWGALLAWVDRAVDEGFVRDDHAAFLHRAIRTCEPARALRRVERRPGIAGETPPEPDPPGARTRAADPSAATGLATVRLGQPTGRAARSREQLGRPSPGSPLRSGSCAVAVPRRERMDQRVLDDDADHRVVAGLVEGRGEGREPVGRQIRADRCRRPP